MNNTVSYSIYLKKHSRLLSLRHYLIPLLLLTYIVLFSVWPFYIDIRVTESIGINPERLIFLLLFFVWLTNLFISNRSRGDFFQKHENISNLIVMIQIYLALRFVSALLSEDIAHGTLLVANELLFNFILFYIVYSSTISYQVVSRMVHVILFCLLFISVYGLYEYFHELNFFRGMIHDENRASLTALEVKYRDSTYRVQSTFEHPLTVAQYILITLPLAVFSNICVRNTLVKAAFFTVIMTALLVTYTRTAIVGLILVFVVYTYYRYIVTERYAMVQKLLFMIMRYLFVLCIIVFVGFVLYTATMPESEAMQQSSNTRLNQYIIGAQLMSQKPFFGVGPGEAAATIKDMSQDTDRVIYAESIDNLFLSKALESGIVSMLLYFAIFGYIIYLVNKRIINEPNEHKRNFLIWGQASVIATNFSMLTLSIFTALPLLFMIIGMLLSSSHVTFPNSPVLKTSILRRFRYRHVA